MNKVEHRTDEADARLEIGLEWSVRWNWCWIYLRVCLAYIASARVEPICGIGFRSKLPQTCSILSDCLTSGKVIDLSYTPPLIHPSIHEADDDEDD